MYLIAQFLREEQAATALEYGLIAGLISIALVVGATMIGSTLSTKFYGPLAAAFN